MTGEIGRCPSGAHGHMATLVHSSHFRHVQVIFEVIL